MNKRDLDDWRAITERGEPVTWSHFVGSVEGATYLSDRGRDLIPTMVAGFEAWFGELWLPRAFGLDSEHRIALLARFSPSLTIVGAQRGMAAAFIELVGWWASMETQRGKEGADRVQRDQRHDVTLPRLLHTLTQLRLGAIATQAGLQVVYEPTPGDLLIADSADPSRCVTVELSAMTASQEREVQERASEEMFAVRAQIGRDYDVHFRGELPALDEVNTQWEKRVREAAERSNRLKVAVSIAWADGELVVVPGSDVAGAVLDGPSIELDVGSRIRRKITVKARQVAAAQAGWLWLENHGAVDGLVPVSMMALGDQLAAYRNLLDGALDEAKTVNGLSISTASRGQWPPEAPARYVDGRGTAFHHRVGPDRVRTTLHLVEKEGPASELMGRIAEQEGNWIDVALKELGVADSALGLIRPDLRAP